MKSHMVSYIGGVIIGLIVGSQILNSHKPTTTPKTAVDIVNYTCTTFDDLTMKCVVNGKG